MLAVKVVHQQSSRSMTTPTRPTLLTKQQSLPTGMPSLSSPQTPLSPFSTYSGIGSPTSSLPPLSPTSPGSYGITPQDGHVHYYEGYIARRSSVLKRWKKRKPYAIVPGTYNNYVCIRCRERVLFMLNNYSIS